MSDSFYVVLTSNQSGDLHPDNNMSNFRVKLAKRLELYKRWWEVACVRFSYTNSLCTFNSTQSVYLTMYPHKREVEVLIAPQIFRDIKHLCTVINESVKDAVTISETDSLPNLTLDHNGRVKMTMGSIRSKLYFFDFSPRLDVILGVDRYGCHYLDAWKTDIYLYLDIIAKRVVGDTMAPLLTTIDVGNIDVKPGEQAIVKIKGAEYSRLVQSEIDEIEVQILDDTGKPPLFEFGVITLTLHFRRK